MEIEFDPNDRQSLLKPLFSKAERRPPLLLIRYPPQLVGPLNKLGIGPIRFIRRQVYLRVQVTAQIVEAVVESLAF